MSEDLFKKAPYLCPWYFNETNPELMKSGEQLRWNYIEKMHGEYVGTWILVDKSGKCFGMVKIYTYILPSSEGGHFLIWSRSHRKGLGFPELKISLYVVADLQPIAVIEDEVLKLKDNNTVFFDFNCEPRLSLSFVLNPDVDDVDFFFPVEFKIFSDFCAIAEIPGLYKDGNTRWHDTAIIHFKTSADKIAIYPQDWFNMSNADFGYQWITRAVINPKTGLIHGRGIRINDFILDRTNRQVLR